MNLTTQRTGCWPPTSTGTTATRQSSALKLVWKLVMRWTLTEMVCIDYSSACCFLWPKQRLFCVHFYSKIFYTWVFFFFYIIIHLWSYFFSPPKFFFQLAFIAWNVLECKFIAIIMKHWQKVLSLLMLKTTCK